MSRAKSRPNPAAEAHWEGGELLQRHPVFRRLSGHVAWVYDDRSACPSDGWSMVCRDDLVHLHPKRLALPEEWVYVRARALLLYAMELWKRDHGDWDAWSAACDVMTARFVQSLALGRPPVEMTLPGGLPQWNEERWYRQFCEEGIPSWAMALRLPGPCRPTMENPGRWGPEPHYQNWSWPEQFAIGIAESVTQSMEMAAGLRDEFDAKPVDHPDSLSATTRRARDWFISSFPLLGSMVASFEIVADAEVCHRENISVAAVDEDLRTIYLNPAAGLNEQEKRFVLAHEVLHVALRHRSRSRGRDHDLWNAACDFVVNDWLIQMQVGTAPAVGLLYDPALRGMSAEEVYDRIANDIRRLRKLCSFAGKQGDMLTRRLNPNGISCTDLDDFCREQLGKGLLLHQQQHRGLIPAGLLEEINAVLQPPIPWEVKLARWFDNHFPPVESHRVWTRLSRRQASTPDIPRPHIAPDPRQRDGRTFGVVLDTSGSMDRHTLAKALGAIASYAESKEVPAVRVVCCDATPYDMGYMPPGDIAGRVQIRGRGGTVLQPGVHLLENAPDFPKDGPLLIITDGDCDSLSITREHAFLLPRGRRLPFPHRGEAFEMG